MMDDLLLEQVRAGYEALHRGDIERYVELLHAELDWRGVEHGFLWWERAPG